MTYYVWIRRALVLSVAIVMLVAIAAAVSAGVYSEPVSNAALGPDWQCNRVAFVLTTCKRVGRGEAAVAGMRKDQDCPRRTVLVWRDGR
jgi:hypothetical protein